MCRILWAHWKKTAISVGNNRCKKRKSLLQYDKYTGKVGKTVNRKEDYIAVFDSGVGGVSVLRQLVKQMPGERFLYYGDSANAPYGTRPTKEVRDLALAVAEKLLQRGI